MILFQFSPEELVTSGVRADMYFLVEATELLRLTGREGFQSKTAVLLAGLYASSSLISGT